MRFSIITPSFQPGPWLRLAIASVADQAGVEAEHLVQDGGSDDGTLDWVREDRRVRVFVEKDAGMYDAINRGLRHASGDILAYLNCDEQYLPGALARVAQFFATHPEVDVLFGDALLVDKLGRALSYRRIIPPYALHTRLDHLGTLSCAMFFRRRLVAEGFLFPEASTAIGDAVFVWTLLTAGKRMASLDEMLATFTFTGNNLGQSGRAIQEAQRWREGVWGWRAARPLVVLHHRFRKWREKAYRYRDVGYSIYTAQSPSRRVQFQALRLGWQWPNSVAST